MKEIAHRSARRPPVFEAPDATWRIDTCRPQIAAAAAGKIRLHALSAGAYPGDPGLRLAGVSSLGHWTAVGAQDWGLEPHRNEGVEICYLESGGMDFGVDGAWHALKPGAVTITRPWQLHRLGRPNIGAGRLHWCILDLGVRRPNARWRWPAWVSLTQEDRGELSERLAGLESPVWAATPGLREAFLRLAEAVQRRPVADSLLVVRLNDMLWELLEILRRGAAPRARPADAHASTVQVFLADLAANPALAARPWTVGGMAGRCGLGITAFTALSRACVGEPPMAFLASCRLRAAASLLRAEPDLPVTQVALRCGFSSGQYFATRFRAVHGCEPSAWRRGAKA